MKSVCASIFYEKNLVGICVFSEKYIIYPYLTDNYSCETALSVINYYKITHLILPIDIDPPKIKILEKSCNETIRIPRCKFNTKFFNNSNMLGNKAFNALCNYLNHTDCSVEPKGTIIGSINSYPISVIENKTKMLLTSEIITQLNLLSTNSSFLSSINLCSTTLGEEKLKLWIQTPLTNLNCIKKRHIQQELVETRITAVLAALKSFKIPNFNKPINIHEIQLFLSGAFALNSLLSSAIKLQNIKIYENLYKELRCFQNNEIQQGVDKKLDDIKRMIKILPGILDEIAVEISKNLDIDLSIIYFPQIGYVIESEKLDEFSTMIETHHFSRNMNQVSLFKENMVSMMDENIKQCKSKEKSSSSEEDKTFSFQFQNQTIKKVYFRLNRQFYYKNADMVELDETFGDIFICAKEREIFIYENMVECIAKVDFSHLFDFIAKVDASAALVRHKIKNGCIKPTLCEINSRIPKIHIKSRKIGDFLFQKNSIVHTSEKFIHNLAKIFILAQIGGYVPCQTAVFPIFDSFLINRDRKYKGSRFLHEMQVQSKFIKINTPKTLILSEYSQEITSSCENIAIFSAIHEFYQNSYSITTTDFNLSDIQSKWDLFSNETDFSQKFDFYFFNEYDKLLTNHEYCEICQEK